LRLATIGHDGVEDVRAKAGFSGMPATPVAIAEQRVKPTVSLTPDGKIVDEFDVAVAAGQGIYARDCVHLDRRLVRPWQSPERMAQDLPPFGIVEQCGDR
jgi:hypothetical protein